MSAIHKLKTLLTDLRDKIQRRQWHVWCQLCAWQVHNLEHERFAIRRAEMHFRNTHAGPFDGANWDCYTSTWHTRA